MKKRLNPLRGSLKAVFDTSPIIVLSKLGLLDKAFSLFEEVEIPSGVLEEINRKSNTVYQEIHYFISNKKVKVEDCKKLFPRLGLGESSAIWLALHKNKIVVLDDRKARSFARDLGLQVIGTLVIIYKLYKDSVLGVNKEIIYNRLREIGFYLDRNIFDMIFKD